MRLADLSIWQQLMLGRHRLALWPARRSKLLLVQEVGPIAGAELSGIGASVSAAASSFFRGTPSSMRSGLMLLALGAAVVGTPAGLLSAQASQPKTGAVGDSLDVVRPGDVVRLKIWREPDMSGDVAVDEAGVAALPRLGALQVANLPADSLKRMLVRSYAKYLRDPAVDVTVLRRITVLGAVRTPNVYHVEPTMTVADAVALAGGTTPDGKQNQVELRRRGGGKSIKLSQRSRLADTPIRSGDELYVPQRSWTSRNAGLVIAGVSTTVSIIYLIFR